MSLRMERGIYTGKGAPKQNHLLFFMEEIG